MSAGTSEFFCLICLLLCSCTAQKITAELGQDVILPCKVPKINNINTIRAVEWIRPDMDPDHVLLYRDGLFDPDSQNPSYQNRVDLQDKEMKDGDFSLILKNVTTEDTGTYMCRVFQKGKKDLISTIFLKVYLSAQEKITTELGKNVILPCKVPNINTVIEWNRPGLDPEHVLLYRDGRLDPDIQHPSYQNRVDLQNKEMKDGNFSMILKNVKMEDKGTYECRVFEEGKNELISIIDLEVLEPDHSWKTEVIVGWTVGAFLVVYILSAFVVYKKLQIWKSKKEMQEELQQRMESEEKLKTVIQNMNKELDEMNFDTNSDPTGSDEKNQQEEVEKLQDEKQKWMKTVGNLKTELQNMNQELEQMGSIPEEVDEDSCFIRLQNVSSKEKKTQQ